MHHPLRQWFPHLTASLPAIRLQNPPHRQAHRGLEMTNCGVLSRCTFVAVKGATTDPTSTADWVLCMAGGCLFNERTWWSPQGLRNARPRDCRLLSSSDRHRCACRGGHWHGQAWRLLRQHDLRARATHRGCLLFSSWRVHRSAGWAWTCP